MLTEKQLLQKKYEDRHPEDHRGILKQDRNTRGHYPHEKEWNKAESNKKAEARQEVDDYYTKDLDWNDDLIVDHSRPDSDLISERRRIRRRVKEAIVEILKKSVEQWNHINPSEYDVVFGKARKDLLSFSYHSATSMRRIVLIRPSEMKAYESMLAQFPYQNPENGEIDPTRLSDIGKNKLNKLLIGKTRGKHSEIYGVEPLAMERAFIAKQIRERDADNRPKSTKKNSGQSQQNFQEDDEDNNWIGLHPDEIRDINKTPLTDNEKAEMIQAKKERHGVR